MKRVFINVLILSCLLQINETSANETANVSFEGEQWNFGNPGDGDDGPRRSRSLLSSIVTVDDHELFVFPLDSSAVITLTDENGVVRVIYDIPADDQVQIIELPYELSGIYLLEIIINGYTFWGHINL
ncbi:MAG: hypothetical protein HUJ98_03760 [Bacteroidaceae bacterium]|nr:hypothetical protein [Bacteroidaceae bacterium]